MGRKSALAAKQDIREKRPHETHFEWRSRITALDQLERDRSEPLISPETERHGRYSEEFVTHVETNTKALTVRNRMTSGIARMFADGGIDDVQFASAIEIAYIAEAIERNVSVRCASLESRVDGSGSARNALLERMAQVRREKAYGEWHQTLPMPKRLVLDMILTTQPLVATARAYRVPWRKARGHLIDALDRWIDIRERVWRRIDEHEVLARYARLGDGELVG